MSRVPDIFRVAFATACGYSISALSANAADLPAPCVAGSCGSTGPATWVTSGSASAVVTGNSLTVQQSSANAVLNWQSFNISKDGSVSFQQPDASSVALNRIFQADPSRILGTLDANGTIFLINQNGILFGQGAKVNVGGLVASSLDVTPQALQSGIAGAAAANGAPAFAPFSDANGAPLASGSVRVETGATVTTAEGGQVLMFAPEVVNQGTISTPGGQTILAAGQSVFLASSTDPNLRGLLVEVGVGGTVTNGASSDGGANLAGAVGQIIAERGNVTLAGLAVNQLGRVSATTSVRQNGSILLQARDGGAAQPIAGGGAQLTATRGGTLQLGPGSTTDVSLSSDADKTVDVNAQPISQVTLDGRSVQILEGSRITARGGAISITARSNAAEQPQFFSAATPDDSRVYVAPGAVLDVAGATVDLPVSSNLVRVELRGNQLADSPLQRSGPLRSEAVFVDVRQSGVRADGSHWQGTPLADVSGDIATIARSVAERSLTGGTVSIASQGSVILAPGATVDLSGGRINYQSGYLNTTQLLGADGKTYDIAAADPNRQYVGIAGGVTVEHPSWGVTETFPGFLGAGAQTFEPGYSEGKDAGSIAINAPAAILDGNVVGNVTVDRYQRNPTSATVGAGALYRPFNEVPAGAKLIVGAVANAAQASPDLLINDISLSSGAVLPELRNADGSDFDPLVDALPEGFSELRLRPDLFGEDRVARVSLFANGTVRLGSDTAIGLPSGGEFAVTAGRVDINGTIDAPSGSIALTSEPTVSTGVADTGLLIDSNTELLARGQWINDAPQYLSAPSLPGLWTNGGSISVTARQGSLNLATGSVFDVSAGAWAHANGSVTGGRGGSIRVAALPQFFGDSIPVHLGAQFRGFSLSQGGALQLTLGAACIASIDCASGASSVTWLAPEFFSAGGFSSYSLTTNSGALTVAPNTIIQPRQLNLQFSIDPQLIPSGTDITGFTRSVMLPDNLRLPTSLSLSTELANSPVTVTDALFASLPGLTFGQQALIDADPLAQISFQSNSRLLLDGTARAPGGTIKVQLDASLGPVGEFLHSQGIWLGPDGILDANGLVQFTPNDLGLRQGNVLPGGAVSVNATRGFFVADPRSSISANGSSATLDLHTVVGGVAGTAPRTVASAGGSISIMTAEGALLNGSLSAASGGAGALGGTLSARLDPNNRAEPFDPLNSIFSTAPRTIVLSQTTEPIVLAPASALPDTLVGQLRLGADRVGQGGFAALDLSAGALDARFNALPQIVPGQIRFEGDVTLNMPRRITLDAAVVSGAGDVLLNAPYIAMGQSDRARQPQVEPSAQLGGSFTAQASLIDLIGNSALDGFKSVMLASEGDLRARGIQAVGSRSIGGSLVTNADLTLQSAQTYATTLSDFTFAVQGNPSGSLTVLGDGKPQTDVLSAGSKLTLTAPTIRQAGVLRAPLGEIDLQATDLVLESGSVVSTSAAGETIPFGTTQGGLDWVYELLDGQTLVFGQATGEVPQQHISLAAANVDVRSGAILDASGGGDLLSYEFVPGTGGTHDVLSAQVNPNEFAIVPALNVQFAPFDQHEYAGSPLQPGQNVHLAAGSGLPEGDYVLLPARYSILPGAFLVRSVSGYQDISPGERFNLLDGSTIVAGVRTVAGTDFEDSRTSGFAVRPASAARLQATYTTTSGNNFFARPSSEGVPSAFRIPNDAGTVALRASSQLALDGSLRASTIGGRGAAVDIAGDLLKVAPAGTPVAPGEVLLDASSLNQLGAESLLIGGQRASSSTGTSIDIVSRGVTIGSGVALHGPEVIVAGQQQVTVESGATLTGSGTAVAPPAEYRIAGDGAVLRVAGGADVPLLRSDVTGASGQLTIENGATLSANGGSIALDASAGARSDGQLLVSAGTLRLGADKIVISDGAIAGSGLVLNSGAIANLNLDQLILSSRSTVDIGSSLDLTLDGLRIEAGGIQAVVPNVVAAISVAGRIDLANPLNLSTSAGGQSGAQLHLRANDIVASDGTFAFSGFTTTDLQADHQLLGTGNAGLSASGELDITTPRVTGDTGANLTLSAGGLLRLLPGASAASPDENAGVGARITLDGARVEDASLIEAHSGDVTLHAQGQGALAGIDLAASGVIDVRGIARSFDGVPVASPAGNVVLSAAAGDVSIGAGSRIDLSAAPGGDAGTLSLESAQGHVTAQGTLLAAAEPGARGGRVLIDAAQVDQLGSLLQGLGDFTDRLAIRQRGAGDLNFAAGTTLSAHNVDITADAGSVLVDSIDASGGAGGDVRLAARDSVIVSGRIDASARDAEGRGGSVELSSSDGGVILASGSVVDVSAGSGTASVTPSDGTVKLRVPQSVLMQELTNGPGQDAVALRGQIVGASRTTLEAFRTYDRAGQLGSADVAAVVANPLFNDATAFMENASALTDALGRSADPDFHIVPGIEIRAPGDLHLAADWNLFPWRFNGEPGVLTLRAAGDLLFDRSLSDGFQATTGANAFTLPTTPGASWSYRLVAGADRSSANTLAVLGADQLGATGGSVRIASGVVTTNRAIASTFRMVRTGTGTIEIAAARDFSLGNQASTLYTAGVSSAGIRFTRAGTLGGRTYPVDGGDISIDVGGNVEGATTNQLVTDWLWRVGQPAQAGSDGSARAWTVNFQRFEQNIGALAGGDVRVHAGGNIDNLSISIPTIGRQIGGTTARDDRLEVLGGGDLTIEAGQSIHGGSFYVARGTGTLSADGDVTTNTGASGTDALYPILALGDARFSVTSRGDLGIDGAVDPFLLPQGVSQGNGLNDSFFSLYTDRSAVSLTSIAGDVTLSNNGALLTQIAPSFNRLSDRPIGLRVYPPSLTATSFSHDLRLAGAVSLFPSAFGNVNLFADRNVVSAAQGRSVELLLSDADPALLPTLATPQNNVNLLTEVLGQVFSNSQNLHAAIPVHAPSQRDGAPEAPARVVARTGDVSFPVTALGDTTVLYFAKPARIVAGRDLIDVGVIAQNLDTTDVTSLIAGRDVRYSISRGDNGQVLGSLRELTIDGPGELQIEAGRNIDLQTSTGISSRGNLVNPHLEPEGAGVSLLAGVGGQSPDYAGFDSRYFTRDSDYGAQLVSFVDEATGRSDLDFDAALSAFAGLDPALRREFTERVFFEELRAGGRAAANSTNSDFGRAFNALTTLFPGSNPAPNSSEQNPYAGDIRLYFSRIYTLAGGDISLLAPGGEVNVGLAAPPTSFGINKQPSQLGLVVQRSGNISALAFHDFQVNESRVFAADGGDILVWSTEGDIDAGRGAKTAISAPLPTINVDSNGRVQLVFPAALTGSGIQTLATSVGRKPGNVDLFAPRGVVNAGDAGIVAGNLTIAATAVLGASNIQVSGTSVGVPVDTGGLGASLAGASSTASSASSAATMAVGSNDQQEKKAPNADSALSWLDVFVIGLGDENCKQDDNECLKRQKSKTQ
jgi:filamentous hemagglutinin